MKGCKCYNEGFKCNQNFQGVVKSLEFSHASEEGISARHTASTLPTFIQSYHSYANPVS